MFSRRLFLQGGALTGLSSLLPATLLPAWARSASGGIPASGRTPPRFNLSVGRFPVQIDGRAGEAVGVNGTLPRR
ncbi:MAG: hypothetical protein R3C04_10140 [Hyphomonas sp.]